MDDTTKSIMRHFGAILLCSFLAFLFGLTRDNGLLIVWSIVAFLIVKIDVENEIDLNSAKSSRISQSGTPRKIRKD